MKNNIFSFLLLASLIFFSGCKFDNYEPPKSFLTGRVVYQNQAIGVRSTGVRLELWQRGFALFNKVDLHIAQDGTFSANLFDGSYQITRMRDNGPWLNQTDTIKVEVRGNTVVDIPVEPFFLVKNEAYTKNGAKVDVTFNLQQVNTTRNLERVNLYISSTSIVDATNQGSSAQKNASAITDLSQPVTLSATLSTALAGKSYVFARIGVKVAGANELIYSAPQKIMLK